ncbi:MAG: hypothetical protein VXX39_00235, partial [Candidatus Thermoplasmatota archaeon]|nr:hypothetical protein [Candidatus Thermoplasmatota archaeon]
VTEALYEHLSTPYKFTQLVNNTAGPVTEDTRSPTPPNILSGQSAGESLETRVEWRNDANEDGESYYIYRNIGDPFDGGNISSSTLEEDGWELLYGPIVETPQSPNTFLSNVPIEADLERNVWYAVVSEDRFGNLNNEIYPGIGGNAIEVLEDTRAPTGEVSIADESSIIYDSISLVQGEYDIRLELNEYLSLSPEVTITMSDGTLYSEEPETMTMLSDNLNDPDRGPVYSMPLSIDSSIESGNLVFTFDVVDASGNSVTITYDERFVDSNRPTLNIYSPSTATDGSKYLFGEKVTVMASAQDDVRIESFRYKFTYKYGIPGESEAAPWGDVTDLTTSEDGSEVYTKMEFPSALFEPGYRHAVELEALDSAGNRVTQRVIFVVDLCVYNEDGTLLCQYDVNVAPPPEPTYEELSVGDPPFLFVWIASGVAVLSMLVAIMVISTSLKSPKQKKKGDDDEDDEDWMSEFIGTSGDLDMDAITGTGSSEEKKEEKVEEKQEESPQDDEDDPFAVNKVQNKRRRKKAEPEPEPEDDFDDDEDEDDFDDEEEEPKKRSPPKRKAVKRTPPKKRSAPVKRKAVKKKE